jgi:transposase
MEQPIWNFEQEPSDKPMDETSVNLRAYFDRMPDAKMQQYLPALTDEQLMEWDGNFKNDGDFMTFCSERDVDVGEYREVLEACIRYRDRVRPVILGQKGE